MAKQSLHVIMTPSFICRTLHRKIYQMRPNPTRTPEELGISLSALSSACPFLGPQSSTCVGIAITQLIKRHSHHLKVVSC